MSGVLETSGTFRPEVIEDIQTKAASGLYRIRGWGTLRERRWATFDDLTFLPCSLTRIPLASNIPAAIVSCVSAGVVAAPPAISTRPLIILNR